MKAPSSHLTSETSRMSLLFYLTFFCLSAVNNHYNICLNRNTADVQNYLQTFFMPKATAAQVEKLLSLYSDDQTQDSPFNTGSLNELMPEFM